MPKRKEPELDPKEQFKRFQETAKELQVDETGKEFGRTFAKVAPKPKPQARKGARSDAS